MLSLLGLVNIIGSTTEQALQYLEYRHGSHSEFFATQLLNGDG